MLALEIDLSEPFNLLPWASAGAGLQLSCSWRQICSISQLSFNLVSFAQPVLVEWGLAKWAEAQEGSGW